MPWWQRPIYQELRFTAFQKVYLCSGAKVMEISCFFFFSLSCYPSQSYFISARHSLFTHPSALSLSAICVVSCYCNYSIERNLCVGLVGFFFSFRRFVLRISYVWWNSVRKIESSNRFVCRSHVPVEISADFNSLWPLPTEFIFQWFSFFWGWWGGREGGLCPDIPHLPGLLNTSVTRSLNTLWIQDKRIWRS
jgi:hypothetical protein